VQRNAVAAMKKSQLSSWLFSWPRRRNLHKTRALRRRSIGAPPAGTT
jgi:hypothetical protein